MTDRASASLKEALTIELWEGKALSECSREELLDVIKAMTPFYLAYMNPAESRTRALGNVEMWKRGEKTV